jgi:hypothetical protein
MLFKNIIGTATGDEEMGEQATSESGGLISGRIGEQLRSGRLAISTGVLWIVRGIRSKRGRKRRLAMGSLAVAVGLLQRRSRRGGSDIEFPADAGKETVADTSQVSEGVSETGMTEVQFGDENTEEPPEDMQTDMEASDELTNDEDTAGGGSTTDEETDTGTDEHETDIGEAPEGEETGIGLGEGDAAEDEEDEG